jgi:hypothetical protein
MEEPHPKKLLDQVRDAILHAHSTMGIFTQQEIDNVGGCWLRGIQMIDCGIPI